MRFFASFSHSPEMQKMRFTRMNIGVPELFAQVPRQGPVDGLHLIDYK